MPSRKSRRVRRKLADGTVKTYEYDLTKRKRTKPKFTLGELIRQYKESPEFLSKKPNAKRVYLRAFDYLKKIEAYDVRLLKRGHFLRIRDKLQGAPAIANQVIAVSSVLMKFAMDRDWRETHPVQKITPLPVGEHRRWTPEEVEFALKVLPERFRRAVLVGLYTGQRQGDCLAMRWSDYDGEGISVVQQKTGAKLWVPCHSVLKAELDQWKKGANAVTILEDSRGKPWRASNFATTFSRAMRDHPELDGCVFHGLRKSAAAMLAEVGCTAHEIAAVTGHRSLQMLAHYTREAEQRTRAKAAIVKLENVRKKTPDLTPQRIDSNGRSD